MRSLCAYAGIAVLSVCASSSLATPYADHSNLEYWAGDQNAEKRAALVIDFGNDNHCAFGYCWDGDATGWDMFSTVCNAGGLTETHTGQVDVGLGIMVKSISYGGLTIDNDDTYEPGDTWLVYWESTDGNNWSTCWSGVSGNAVSDGGWNGWTATPAGDWPGDPPIPEPATVATLALGAAVLVKRRKT